MKSRSWFERLLGGRSYSDEEAAEVLDVKSVEVLRDHVGQPVDQVSMTGYCRAAS